MAMKKTDVKSSNWPLWIRDIVIVNIGVALFFLLMDELPLWTLGLPIILGFFAALCLRMERRVRYAFTLFIITWLIFALIGAIRRDVDDIFTFAIVGIYILLLMFSGLGFSYFASKPRDVKDDRPLTWKSIRRPITWKGVGLISFFAVMIFMLGTPGGHPPPYNAIAKSALKNLATLQEVYYVENETYTKDLNELSKTMSIDENIKITILSADKERWAATASHVKSKDVFTYTSEQGLLGQN